MLFKLTGSNPCKFVFYQAKEDTKPSLYTRVWNSLLVVYVRLGLTAGQCVWSQIDWSILGRLRSGRLRPGFPAKRHL